MKQDLVFDYLHLRRRIPASKLAPPPHGQRKKDIPDAPPFTVK
jgi:hypothetical protein